MCSITALLCTILIRNRLCHFLNAHSQTAHLIIFTGYSDKQSNIAMLKSFTRGTKNQSLQGMCITLMPTFCITVALVCGSIVMLLMNSIHRNASAEREREEGKMEWLASGLQICLGLVVSENLPPSLRKATRAHTHIILFCTVPQDSEATSSGSKPKTSRKIFHTAYVYIQQVYLVDVSQYYMQILHLKVKS